MLTAIELIGFKSFANRTKLEFGEGITAIVGPPPLGSVEPVAVMNEETLKPQSFQ